MGNTMTKDNLLSRISIDPNICFGKPHIRGHRIPVSLILDLLAGGETIEAILEEYPSIEQKTCWLVLPMEQKCHGMFLLKFL
ncbi:hypothetical protein NUACC21_37590 [Scytonema sp. NUACC21]